MVQRLPSLRGLEAFVLAGQLGSIRQAADTLNLTPSALSRRVQNLENDLGLILFERSNREIRLTQVGERYLNEITPAFRILREASQRARNNSLEAAIRVGIPPGFAIQWLLPHLNEWREQSSQVRLEFDTAPDALERLDSELDAAVVWRSEVEGGDLSIDRLGDLSVFPVISPKLLEELGESPSPTDLARLPRLTMDTMPDVTTEWLAHFGLAPTPPEQVIRFDSGPMLVEAAANGLGFTFSFEFLAGPYLRDGRLVRPFDLEIESSVAYHFVCKKKRLRERTMQRFRDWILTQAYDVAA